MKISTFLSIIGWVLLLISFFFRSNHAEKRFGYLIDVKRYSIGFNFAALICFIISILFSIVWKNLNILL